MASNLGRAGALLVTCLGVAGIAGVGCGSGAPDTPSSSEQFIATAASFSNFCSWKSAPATNGADASDGIHGLGPLTVYWNQSPPHGATAFPVGTIIVKADQNANPQARTIFAMVKRGGGYNPALNGWEWFSLQQESAACDDLTVLWHSVAPPAGETYAGSPAGDCNGCHAAAGNDGVWDSALQLTSF